ncbi:DNA-processing protein DprA [Clostridium taeniosporum]|uniref:DNA-processing protein DprA n=1 Tax=Clostridium taeniosporum TaxID=394958 RepID=A0A1D7XIW4_9CLOT|nr:DNA-processing protein DprA [Clostridium taeniosporum]AOR23265.1 DNA-processing protein DprA [Clostridium taeniosporum]
MLNYELWFILLNISNKEKISLIDEYENEENIYNNFENILKENKKIQKKLGKFEKNDLIYEIISLNNILNKKSIGYITYSNPLYKERLRLFSPIPYYLFYKGNIQLINEKSIAIVGARKCSNYALAVTKLLTKEIITNNITLISGGARGVDSIAHKSALENGGRTIIVLGCGIDVVYPAENKALFSKVIEDGLIISEFPLGTKPLRHNFPLRNRIISGLSDGVIVIEASEKSGSLITARIAQEQNKDVLVVPGSILYEGAKGSNKLIKDGCDVLTSINDLSRFFEKNHMNIQPMKIRPEKREILDMITDAPIHIDDIFKNSCVDRGALYALLFEMQIKNEIICLPGNYYIKII